MATIVQFPQKPPEEVADDYLRSAPAKYLGCRGFGHAYPKPGDRRTKKLFVLTVDAEGNSCLAATCRDCGKIRFVDAEPGVVIQLPAKRYRYDDPPGYAAKGAGRALTRRMCAEEAMRRYYEELQHPTGGEEMPRFFPEDVPQAQFQPPEEPEPARRRRAR